MSFEDYNAHASLKIIKHKPHYTAKTSIITCSRGLFQPGLAYKESLNSLRFEQFLSLRHLVKRNAICCRWLDFSFAEHVKQIPKIVLGAINLILISAMKDDIVVCERDNIAIGMASKTQESCPS